jgi:hypothetical protein
MIRPAAERLLTLTPRLLLWATQRKRRKRRAEERKHTTRAEGGFEEWTDSSMHAN